MTFEIDVSGEDIFSKNYTIVLADKDNLIRGFKFNEESIKIIRSRHGENKYRYPKSRHGTPLLKVRLYCVVIYYLFKDIKLKDKEIYIEICRDFHGHEREITSQLKYFLEDRLGLKITIHYLKLPKGSNADRYAHLMRKDKKNLMKNYVSINIKDIEKYFLKK